jgi:hypothetical protein
MISTLLLAPLIAVPSFAQTMPQEQVDGGVYDASDPEALTKFMTQTGYRVRLTRDPTGNPLIEGRISRSDYALQFYECENGAFCNSVQLIAVAPAPADATLESLNAFNARWRYVRATLIERQVRLQLDINLDAGVTADNLRDTLDIWRRLLETFERDVLHYG